MKEYKNIMIFKLLTTILILLLGGCAHQVSIAPSYMTVDEFISTRQKVPASVGFYIPQNLLEKEVTTPGGGGDKITYFPYRDLEASLKKVLESIYEKVSYVKALNAKENNVDLVISPEIRTNSSTSNNFMWPPTSFSVELDTLIYDKEGMFLKKISSIGMGETNFSETIDSFKQTSREGKARISVSGVKAVNDALQKMQSSLFNLDINDLSPDFKKKYSNLQTEKLRAEAEEAKRKKAELEEQLHLAQQQARPMSALTSSPMTNMANRRALVIGNDTYKSVAKLLNAREDARTMASNLTSVGYQVTLKLDLNEKEMKAALRTFANQVQGGDEVLFFFAGHGVQLGSTNYLLPIDIGGESEAQVKDESIQLQRILDDMFERKAKFTLAMIDACRDNPFKSSGRAIGGRGLAPTNAATGQMVIFSAGTGQQALDKLNNADKNKNGLFTRVFVQEMQIPNQTIDRVVKNVRNQVAELAKSVGHEQVPAIYDQVLGDFYFKK